ncbi:hypothetical protein CASFOL_038681 [Castilleja foliolosa]|uniref:Uncharacterized protein n=1 Tax=Castilleja foliolosa TaxID=1961234 RepID=A0ABD3BLN3_9LAMI
MNVLTRGCNRRVHLMRVVLRFVGDAMILGLVDLFGPQVQPQFPMIRRLDRLEFGLGPPRIEVLRKRLRLMRNWAIWAISSGLKVMGFLSSASILEADDELGKIFFDKNRYKDPNGSMSWL